MNPLIQLKTTILPVLITFVLGCFGLSPAAQALLPPPPPDGGYPGGNTAEGTRALKNLTNGIENTAIGLEALFKDMSGDFNTATGSGALHENTTGNSNTAYGRWALYDNNGDANTAVGRGALKFNTTGGENTATGFRALHRNTIGDNNTGVGSGALFHNSETADLTDQGNDNSAFGAGALFNNDSGSFNTAIGNNALAAGKGYVGDTAVGAQALQNLQRAVADLLSPDANIALGFAAGFNLIKGSHNIYIGSLGPPAPSSSPSPTPGEEFDTIRIGNIQRATFIAGIRDVTTGIADAMPVVIDSAGQLGTASSSARFKNEIKPMNKTSEAILALKPVTFHFKSDSKRTPQFGLIAEEVAQVNPNLVVRDKNGEIYTVRYEAVNAMLLNEFLKAHSKIENQQATIAELKSTVAQEQKGLQTVTTRLEQQAAEIQKVSAQLEASKPAPQVVNNP